MSRDSIKRAIRTFVIATLALWIPGLLGWINELTQWARDEGSTPFPDARGLAYLGVSAIAAGFVAALNLLWNGVEDATGKGFLRTVPPKAPPARTQAGAVVVPTWLYVVLVVVVILVVLALLL